MSTANIIADVSIDMIIAAGIFSLQGKLLNGEYLPKAIFMKKDKEIKRS